MVPPRSVASAAALTLALTLLPATTAATPSASAAAKSSSWVCATVNARTLYGVDYGRLKVKRRCVLTRDFATSGESKLGANTLTVSADPRATRTEVAQTTLHELVHHVDWRTTKAYRKQLYSFLGYRTNGSFWSVPSPAANWDGRNLNVWRSDPHERLAESVVRCQTGSARLSGMKLVPKSRCAALLSTYKKAMKAVR